MNSKFTKSNLDLTGCKLVKRGALVSWHGIRFYVSKVRLGVFYPDSESGLHTKFFHCSEVQVVGQRVALRRGPACGVGPQREAHPVGNTGITINHAKTI